MKKIIIAIDGPASSGKSTLAKKLADYLKFLYLDTGAMYRAITYCAINKGIVDNEEKVIELTKNIALKLKFENSVTRVWVDDIEITEEIRLPYVNAKVSEISCIEKVREEMVSLQRVIANQHNVITEGRDTTTVVFPEADIKIFLTASIEARAKRRFKEFLEKNQNVTFEEVLENIKKRDSIDSGRSISPLRKAADAIEIDTTNISVEQEKTEVLALIANLVNEIIK
ncbi:MAG: (d)CMP kinase [bacterium]